MRFFEFETVSDKAADAYKSKQLKKAKEKKQRELARKNSSNNDDESLKDDVLAAISAVLIHADEEAVTATTVKTSFI